MLKVKTLSAVLLGAAITAAAGCAMAKTTTVSFMTWITNKEDTLAFKRMIQEFEKGHPDVKVRLIAEAWAGDVPYFSKYITMTTGGVAPDVVMIPFMWVPNFAEANILEELTPYVNKSKLKLNQWTDAGLAASRWKGRLWGLPGGTTSDWWVTYNKKVMAQSGVIEPVKLAEKGGWNWEAMEMIAQKTSKFDSQGKVSRIGIMQMADIQSMTPFIWGMGGEILSADGFECKLGESKAIEAMNKVHNLIFNKKVMGLCWAPPYNLDLAQAAKKEQFAMTPWWNTLTSFYAAQKINWPLDLVPFPAGPVEPKTNMMQAHSMCISKQSKVKNASWELVSFLSGQRGQTIMAEDLQGLPTRKDVLKRFRDILADQKFAGGEFLEDALARQRIWDRSPKMHLALPKINDQVSRIWTGKVDVATALKDAVKTANVELARGKKK